MQILDNNIYEYEYCTQTKPSKRAIIHSQIRETGYKHYNHHVEIEADKQFLLFIERGLRRLEAEYTYNGNKIEFTLAVEPSECVFDGCSKCDYDTSLLESLVRRAKHEYYVDQNNIY